MYLSRIELDTKSRETMRALASPSRFHGAVERAFDGDRSRNLWRIDTLGDRTYLLLLSRELPRLDALATQFGYGQYETRDYDKLLSRIADGRRFRFRLVANPTFSKSPGKDAVGSKTRGRVIGCSTPEYQAEWLCRRAESHGFSVMYTDENETRCSFTITKSRRLSFDKGSDGRNVKLLSVTYEGELTVTDVEKFKALLCDGIGRGKAYGQGMMTVVSIE